MDLVKYLGCVALFVCLEVVEDKGYLLARLSLLMIYKCVLVPGKKGEAVLRSELPFVWLTNVLLQLFV